MSDKLDGLRKDITDRVVEMMKQDGLRWSKSWVTSSGLPLRHDGRPYRGINVLLLGMAAMSRGLSSPYWLSMKQVNAVGGRVKKGAKSEISVFWKPLEINETDADGNTAEKKIMLMRYYRVFNASECENLPPRYQPKGLPNTDERIAHAEAWFANTGAKIEHGTDQPCYVPSKDIIRMPVFEAFDDAPAYYATLAHEVTHWTGHETRRDRNIKNAFGEKDYAYEELVAELGACFQCAELGIEPEPREDHAAYLASWIKRCEEDPRLIFKAASAASYAVDYLHELQPQAEQAAA